MSECTLYILDAPRIKLQSAAESFIEKWQDAEPGPPNAKLDGFLDDFLRDHPDLHDLDPDGTSEHNLWYEGLRDRTTDRPFFQLDLKLALVTKELIANIWALARKHRLHLFDPAGYVLYLANGKEVSSESDDAARQDLKALASGAPLSADGLRFDGVYAGPLVPGKNYSYYRFTSAGRVYRTSLAGPVDAMKAFLSLHDADAFTAVGKYSVKQGVLEAKLKSSSGQFIVKAVIEAAALKLESVRTDGRFLFRETFDFAAVDASNTAEA